MLETSSDWGGGAPIALTSSGGSSATPSLGAGTPYFDIKINEVSPSEVSGMDVNQIMGILHNLDVDGVTEAAEAHMNLGDKLDQVANRLAQNAHTLAANWQGTAAQAAMDKFQQMHVQTAQLAAQARQTGQVLHWTAGVMQKYKNLPTPQGESAMQADEQTGSHIGGEIGGAPGSLIGDGIGAIAGAFGVGGGNQAKANAQAQKYLTALNQHLVSANNALPSTIGAPGDLAGGTGLGPAATGGSGGASGTGGAGAVVSAPPTAPFSGGGAGSGGGSVRPPHISEFNPAPLPHGGATPVRTPHNYTPPPGGTLQSYTPPPGGTSTLPPPSTTPPPGGPVGGGNVPTFTPGPLPNSTNVPNRGSDLASDEPLTEDGALPGDTGTGVDGAADGLAAESGTGSAIGSEGADGEIGAADASAVGAEGEGMGFPMTGGSGSGQQDKERQRQAWMNEDADLWGMPKDNVGPVIEGNN
jgi:hypothetical protein